jgi:retinol dehydrogenase-14
MATILITGATSGIGLEAAVALARPGNRLVMLGRDPRKMNAAVDEVKHRAGVAAAPDLWLCDFGSQAQIRKVAADVLARYDRLDVLVNNAGLATLRREVTEDGIERTFAVNHLAPFLLTNLLLDLLLKSAPARVVNVASNEHYDATMDLADLGFERGGWGMAKAYGRSKLGTVLFTRALAKRLDGKGVTVNAVHPGAVATGIWDCAPGWMQPMIWLAKRLIMITPKKAAKSILQLISSADVEGKTGLYFDQLEPKEPSKLALDDELAEKLWAESARLVKLSAASGQAREESAFRTKATRWG